MTKIERILQLANNAKCDKDLNELQILLYQLKMNQPECRCCRYYNEKNGYCNIKETYQTEFVDGCKLFS